MKTIRGRLLVTLLSGLALVLVAGGAAVYLLARASLVQQFDEGLQTRAQTIAALVTYEPPRLVFASGDGPDAVLDATYFELRTPAGRVLKRSANLGDSALPGEQPPVGTIVFGDVALPGDGAGRAAWLAFMPRVELDDDDDDDDEAVAPTEAPEAITVVAAMDRGPIDRALATLLGALLVVGCVVGVAIVVLVAVGVRWGLIPLDRLSQQLGAVDGATISRRLDDGGAPRELVPIYRELNGVLDRVEQTLDRERSFADAAAHELRTPIAELRTIAEVAVRWPDAERSTAALKEVLTVGREMEHLVESLLLISRGHATEKTGDGTAVAPIVASCLTRAGPAISAKSLDITVAVDGDGTLGAPHDAVEIIVRNLIDNAVRYTPEAGHISISGAGAANGSPALIVENDPVELSDDDLGRLFEPFWRRDGSRSDRHHVGLGLAVVQQIADAIDLRIDAALVGDRLSMTLTAKR